ncbi:hypothetical protein BDR26DRAFT_870617 [Obelidium mucronatum]|nr:hypothetical protein BDR26DRAFT_870617 [Obelidium mucronatum]
MSRLNSPLPSSLRKNRPVSRPVSELITGIFTQSLTKTPSNDSTSLRSSVNRRSATERNETTASIAAALFGDANMPMAELVEMTEKETNQQMKTFMLTREETTLKLYAAVSDQKMKVFLKSSRAKVFDIDLSKWDAEGIITINDLRDDYKSTEITNICRDSNIPNLYSVCAHTQMLSNQSPQGAIIVESDFKVIIHSENNSVRSEKPIFSITGEFKQGRFMIIGRNDSRQQRNVGNSSGWVAERDDVAECNFEVEEDVFFDQYEIEANTSNPILIRRSPLLIAGIVVALASKKLGN